MLGLFPNGEMPDISQLETAPINLDYFDIEGWSNATNMSAGLRE